MYYGKLFKLSRELPQNRRAIFSVIERASRAKISMPLRMFNGRVWLLWYIASFIFIFDAMALEDGCLSFYGFENASDMPEMVPHLYDGWQLDTRNGSFSSGIQSPSTFWIRQDGPLEISFIYKVSTRESGKGVFQFLIDGTPQQIENRDDWCNFSPRTVPGEGPHELKWVVYKGKKDYTAWINSLCIRKSPCSNECPTSASPISPITPPTIPSTPLSISPPATPLTTPLTPSPTPPLAPPSTIPPATSPITPLATSLASCLTVSQGDQGGNLSSICEFAQSKNISCIYIKNGIYNLFETIHIYRDSFSIIGESRDCVIIQPAQIGSDNVGDIDGIKIYSDKYKIRNITVKNLTLKKFDKGINTSSSDSLISNVHLDQNVQGIYVESARNCNITLNKFDVLPRYGFAINVDNCNFINVARNSISGRLDERYGILFENVSSSNISNNSISIYGGIMLLKSKNDNIIFNDISGTFYSIALVPGCININVTKNNIKGTLVDQNQAGKNNWSNNYWSNHGCRDQSEIMQGKGIYNKHPACEPIKINFNQEHNLPC